MLHGETWKQFSRSLFDVPFQFAEGQGVLLNVNTQNQIEVSRSTR